MKPLIVTTTSVFPHGYPQKKNHRPNEHLIPGEGTLDFDMLIDSLNEIGYKGDCVLEAHHQSVTAPDEARDEILIRLLTSARKIREK